MAEDFDNHPARTLEPGAIERTKKNIGPIDAYEAVAMQKVLGGEVLKERSIPVDTSNLPRQKHRQDVVVRASGFSSADISEKSSKLTATSSVKPMESKSANTKKKKTEEDLPALAARDMKLMDKLMMSAEYEIKPNFGLFNVFFRMSAKNKEKVTKSFGEYIVKRHVEHMQAFTSTIKTFIQLAPDSYKSKIATETDLKFKFLRTVGKWTMRDIKVLSLDIQNAADNLTVSMLIPFVRAMYHELLTIYYIGEQQVPALIKEIYTDIISYPDVDKAKMQTLAKQGITEWIYIHNQIIKGMYPLLMRMCATEYVEFPKFFTAQIAQILSFLNITKFDLLLPEKKKEDKEKKKKEEEEAKKKERESRHIAGQKDNIVLMGIKILDQLFPEAGFTQLEKHPDLYPYFQPIYNFADGFNVLDPKNPMQVTIVLIRIIEEFFQGCRNIKFNITDDEKLNNITDDLSEAMSDWAFYHEELFDQKLGDYLRTYVNSIYSTPDYINAQYGKENLNNILWRIKYFFLPNYQFSAPILQKPVNDSKYKPLYARTDYLRTLFTTLVRRIDENAGVKGPVLGVLNPWDRYVFDLPNSISTRLDVLLGAKKDDATTGATNANLIKYTLCVIAVLDWWINNSASPAYTVEYKLYRISEKDGQPQFSVPVRTDQKKLFAESLKKQIAAKSSN